MADAFTRGLVRLHDQALHARSDEAGLTMLAYALGAALVVVPLAAALFLFGTDSANTAASRVDAVLGNT